MVGERELEFGTQAVDRKVSKGICQGRSDGHEDEDRFESNLEGRIVKMIGYGEWGREKERRILVL